MMKEYDIDYKALVLDCWAIVGFDPIETLVDILQNPDIFHSEAEIEVFLEPWRAYCAKHNLDTTAGA